MKYFITLILILLIGCSTRYKQYGLTGGYTDTQLAPDIFIVKFNGNAYTNISKTREFVLLRSSELSLQNGYHYFEIITGDDDYNVSKSTTPIKSETKGHIDYYGKYRSETTYSGGETSYRFRPRSEYMIKCYTKKPYEKFVFDAEFLNQSLSKKYDVEPYYTPQTTYDTYDEYSDNNYEHLDEEENKNKTILWVVGGVIAIIILAL